MSKIKEIVKLLTSIKLSQPPGDYSYELEIRNDTIDECIELIKNKKKEKNK